MNKLVIVFLLLFFAMPPALAADLEALEKIVIERAEKDPATATEYFLSMIERRPSPGSEEQAVYVLGMGIAAERQGHIVDALDYYLGAEALGNKTASKAAEKLKIQVKP